MKRMDAKERVIRELYDARTRRDWDAVGSLLAKTVGWHEPGEEGHSGSFRGRDEVVALLEKLVDVTGGTFQLVPVGWPAGRGRRRWEGREIAVDRVEDRRTAEVWFYNEPADPEAFSAVFA